MELLKNLEGLSADEQMTAVVELQKAAMKHLEEQKQASIGKSAELVIQGLKKIKSDFEAKFDSLNYDIQTKVASLKDGEQGLQGPKGDQGERGLDGSNGRDGRDGKDGKDGVDGVDGVGVRDAKIDFDGSLVISLTDGREINCGEVVSVDVAKQIQKVTHNIQTGSGGDSQTVLDAIAAIQATIATYGTMATQNANNVAITGGAINNTTIGATTPSTGVFTTLTATGQTSLGGAAGAEGLRVIPSTTGRYLVARGSSGNPDFGASGGTLILYGGANSGIAFYSNGYTQAQFNVAHTASAVNYVQVTGGATGVAPVISSQGSDSNVALNFSSKGTSGFNFYTDSGTSSRQFRVDRVASSVNFLAVTGAATGNAPSLSVSSLSSDTNIDLNLTPKGAGVTKTNGGLAVQSGSGTFPSTGYGLELYNLDTGSNFIQSYNRTAGSYLNTVYNASAHLFRTSGAEQLRVSNTASAVNYVQVTGAATGGQPTISTQGSDANINLVLNAKGSSSVLLQTAGQNVFQATGSGAVANRLLITGTASGVAPSVSCVGSDTNIPLVLQPAGTGALQAQQTDSTATGGNARGANAVDWQTTRTTASMVASGSQAVLVGGQNNTVASSYCALVGGAGNTSNGYGSFLGSGNANSISGSFGVIGGGNSNTATRDYASVLGGQSNTATGYYNVIGGGFTNTGTANAAVTTQSATMNGTTAVTLAASNASIKVGQYITGTSIAGDTYVAAISGTSLTLSKNASGSSTSTLSFFTPHGVVVGGGNNQATGSYSFIGGGGDAGTAANRNVASGDWSVVGGGRQNTASGVASFVGGGGVFSSAASNNYPNTASGSSSTVCGGLTNSATNSYASVLGGFGNAANGIGSTAFGVQSTARAITGYFAYGGCDGAVAFGNGVSQAGLLLLGRQTTDATATVLTSNSSAAGTNNQVILPNNSAYYFRGEVISGVTGGGNTKGWTIEGVIKRGANAASTTLVGSTVTSMYADAGAVTWTIALSADTTNGGLAVTFTGQAATTIRTVAQIRTTEMTY